MTIKNATKRIYEFTPRLFSFPRFAEQVQKRMNYENRNPMDGTIQRELRNLRQKGELNYRVFDRKKSIYEKL